MENWAAIAAEVAGAIGEVGYSATLSRPAAVGATPWDAATGTAETFEITVIDGGIRTRYSQADNGAMIPRRVRAVTVPATGEAPRMGDTITLADGAHEVVSVSMTAPGGVALKYKVELEI